VPLLISLVCLSAAAPALGQERGEATIKVAMRFDPRILDIVDVELICSMENRMSRTFAMAREEARSLALGGLQTRGNSCQVRALPPVGHTARYAGGGDSAFGADRNGCHFTDIDRGEVSNCQIEVIQDPVRLTVYKKWVGPSGQEADVEISLACESGDYSGVRFINEGKPGGWDITNIGPEGVLCNVSEEVRDTYRPDIIDCQGLWVLPGKGEECTLLNTKIVKRIEMLNRYGKIIMILLVMGIGMAAIRRFS
jgi:hypothetical protein